MFDRLVRELTGVDLRARVALTPGLLIGAAPRARVTLADVDFAGLRLARIDLRVADLRIVGGLPPKVRAASVVARIRVEQAALDAWSRAANLPVRLRLRDGGITAIAGIGGLRLSETDVATRLVDGRIQLAAQRVSLLGIGLATPIPPVTLPLPPLPRRAELVGFEPADGSTELTLRARSLDEPISIDRARQLLDLVRASWATRLRAPQRGPSRRSTTTL